MMYLFPKEDDEGIALHQSQHNEGGVNDSLWIWRKK